MEKKRYIVTGSDGFIGTNLVKTLESIGHEVIKFDKRTGKDITKPDTFKLDNLITKFVKIDAVFHLAAIPSHRLSVDNPYEILYNNYLAMLNVLEFCRKNKIKLIHASSFSVYGNQPTPWREDDSYNPTTPYAYSKVFCEELIKSYVELNSMKVIIARFSNVFGPHEEKHLPLQVLPIWLNNAKEGLPLDVYGRDTTRDFTYVGDVVNALLLLSEQEQFGIYNVCAGQEIKLIDVAKAISNKIFVHKLPDYEATKWVGANSQLRDLGWEPTKNVFDWIEEVKENEN